MAEPQLGVSSNSSNDAGEVETTHDERPLTPPPVFNSALRSTNTFSNHLPKALHFLYFSASGCIIPFLPLFYSGLLSVVNKKNNSATSDSTSNETPFFYYSAALIWIGLLTAIPPLFVVLLQPLWILFTTKIKKQRLLLMSTVVLAMGCVLAIGLVTPGYYSENIIYLLPLVIAYAFFNTPIDGYIDNVILELYDDRETNSSISVQKKTSQDQKALWTPLGYGFGALLVALCSAFVPSMSPMYSYAAQMICLFLFIALCLDHDREEESCEDLDGRANFSNEEPTSSLLASPSDDSLSTATEASPNRRSNLCKQRYRNGSRRKNILKRLLRSLFIVIKNRQAFFFLQSFLILGACSSISSSFLFIYAVDKLNANVLQLSLSVVISCFAEMLAVLFAPHAIRKIGLGSTIVAASLAWSARGFLYTIIPTPWLLLPVEMLHSISFSGFWIAGPISFREIAPKGLEVTPQNMLQIVYYLGCAIGSVVGGVLYTFFGPVVLFRTASISATAGLFFMILFSRFVDAKLNEITVISLIRTDMEADGKAGVFEDSSDLEEGIEMELISQDNTEEATDVSNEKLSKSYDEFTSSRRKEKLPDLDEEVRDV